MQQSHAQDTATIIPERANWEIHESATGIFDVRFPKKYQYKIFPLQYNKDIVAYTSEIAATSSIEGFEKDKTIFVKATQTLGPELTKSSVARILKRARSKYLKIAEKLNGKVITDKDIKQEGFFGHYMHITYDDNGTRFALRVNIFTTNYARIEQVMTGPEQTMFSYQSDVFFDSIALYDGITSAEGVKIGTGWKQYQSKNNMFTAVLPPQNEDYTPHLPLITATSRTDTLHYEINDPLFNQRVFYNVTAYKTGRNLTFNDAKKVLASKHFVKYASRVDMSTLDFERGVAGELKVMKTKFKIPPLKDAPYISRAYFDTRFVGDVIVVQEFLTSPRHAAVGIQDTLFSLLKFHPGRYDPVSK